MVFFKLWFLIGKSLIVFPVAAARALITAGVIAAMRGSPTPPQFPPVF
jgi:hypothetical protein